MKFLVISTFKDTFYAHSSDEIKQMVGGAVDFIKQMKEQKKILEIYTIPGWNRNVSIEEHDSSDELYEHLHAAPHAPYTNFEVYPLADFEKALKILLK